MYENDDGFTLAELLAVVAVLAILAVLAAPGVAQQLENFKRRISPVEARALVNALELYQLDAGHYPSKPYNPLDNTEPFLETEFAALMRPFLYRPKYTNGFNRGFIYITDYSGAYYILGDAVDYPDTFRIVCLGNEYTNVHSGDHLWTYRTAFIASRTALNNCHATLDDATGTVIPEIRISVGGGS